LTQTAGGLQGGRHPEPFAMVGYLFYGIEFKAFFNFLRMDQLSIMN